MPLFYAGSISASKWLHCPWKNYTTFRNEILSFALSWKPNSRVYAVKEVNCNGLHYSIVLLRSNGTHKKTLNCKYLSACFNEIQLFDLKHWLRYFGPKTNLKVGCNSKSLGVKKQRPYNFFSDWAFYQPDEQRKARILEFIEAYRTLRLKKTNSASGWSFAFALIF